MPAVRLVSFFFFNRFKEVVPDELSSDLERILLNHSVEKSICQYEAFAHARSQFTKKRKGLFLH